jgi:hypothetical protein
MRFVEPKSEEQLDLQMLACASVSSVSAPR